jgi:hypothetical protein
VFCAAIVVFTTYALYGYVAEAALDAAPDSWT